MARTALNSRKTDPRFSAQKPPVKPCPQPSAALENSLRIDDFERLSQDYLLDCDYRLQSRNTIQTRRVFIRNLTWFLHHRGYKSCGTPELRQFFVYLARGHEEPGGRWGQAQYNKPVRPVTIKDYYVNLRCLFNWLVEDGAIATSPLDKIPKPVVRTEQIQPFSEEQIQALLKAARLSSSPTRDEAIVLAHVAPANSFAPWRPMFERIARGLNL